MSFETEHLNNDDIEILTQVGAKVEDTGKGTGKVTCGKGMKTDSHLFLEQFGRLSHLGMLQEQFVIHDHMYANLETSIGMVVEK